MTIRPVAFGAAQPAPRFGMTPEQQKDAREQIFDTLYPHLNRAVSHVRSDYARLGQGRSGDPRAVTDQDHAANTIVSTLAQLSTVQEAPPRPNGFNLFI